MKSSRIALIALAAMLSGRVFAQEALFPKALHLTRTITDPLSGAATVDEYLVGNRVVSVRGEKTVIVDYTSSQITVIDRARSEFSISTFEEYAASRPAARNAAAKMREPEWRFDTAAPESRLGRGADVVVAQPPTHGEIASVRIVSSRDVELGEDAFGALSGSRYPGNADATQRVIAHAVQRGDASAKAMTRFALPLETIVTFDVAGQQLVLRNEITSLREEEPAPQLVQIPAGAKRVPSPFVNLERELEQLDHPNINH